MKAALASAPRRPYVHSGQRPKPDVGNLVRDQAHAPLPLPAGHARMPPGLQYRRPSSLDGVSTPHVAAFNATCYNYMLMRCRRQRAAFFSAPGRLGFARRRQALLVDAIPPSTLTTLTLGRLKLGRMQTGSCYRWIAESGLLQSHAQACPLSLSRRFAQLTSQRDPGFSTHPSPACAAMHYPR